MIGKTILTSLSKYPSMRKNVILAAVLSSLISCGNPETNEGNNFDCHVCAFIWPSCHDDSLAHEWLWEEGIGEWEVIKKGNPRFDGHYQPKEPLWGYEMDDDPAVVEKWIQTALKYGVNTFIYDWYWFDRGPYLESALDNGFLKAPSHGKMDFYIMWANHDVKYNYWNYHKWGDRTDLLWTGAINPEDWPKIVERVIRLYFHEPNYVKIDGCPVFGMFSVENFVKSFSSVENARAAMDYFRSEVRKAGFPGLNVQMIDGGGPVYSDELCKSRMEQAEVVGIDSWAYYNMGCFNTDYLVHAQRAAEERDKWAAKIDMPYFPCVSIAWDDTPRFPAKGADDVTLVNATPENFGIYLQKAKEFAESRSATQPKFVMINAWNEWVEGSYLLPDKRNGFGYLEAVQKVFAAE